jgi:hypothetical protein
MSETFTISNDNLEAAIIQNKINLNKLKSIAQQQQQISQQLQKLKESETYLQIMKLTDLLDVTTKELAELENFSKTSQKKVQLEQLQIQNATSTINFLQEQKVWDLLSICNKQIIIEKYNYFYQVENANVIYNFFIAKILNIQTVVTTKQLSHKSTKFLKDIGCNAYNYLEFRYDFYGIRDINWDKPFLDAIKSAENKKIETIKNFTDEFDIDISDILKELEGYYYNNISFYGTTADAILRLINIKTPTLTFLKTHLLWFDLNNTEKIEIAFVDDRKIINLKGHDNHYSYGNLGNLAQKINNVFKCKAQNERISNNIFTIENKEIYISDISVESKNGLIIKPKITTEMKEFWCDLKLEYKQQLGDAEMITLLNKTKLQIYTECISVFVNADLNVLTSPENAEFNVFITLMNSLPNYRLLSAINTPGLSAVIVNYFYEILQKVGADEYIYKKECSDYLMEIDNMQFTEVTDLHKYFDVIGFGDYYHYIQDQIIEKGDKFVYPYMMNDKSDLDVIYNFNELKVSTKKSFFEVLKGYHSADTNIVIGSSEVLLPDIDNLVSDYCVNNKLKYKCAALKQWFDQGLEIPFN